MSFWQRTFGNLSQRTAQDNDIIVSDVDSVRAKFDALTTRQGAMPDGASSERVHLGAVPCDWVRADAAAGHRVILYFHGGGYVSGAAQDYRPLVARLCQAAQANAFAVDYRLAPEFPFPAALHDGIDAYRTLLKNGVPASQIVFAGDGAGGGLVFAILIAIRAAGLAMPAACVAMSPWADLSLTGLSILKNADKDKLLSWELLFMSARHYLDAHSPTDPYASPLYASFQGFPPIMVHAGSQEILRDDASRIGDRALEADVPASVEVYDGMQHVFQAHAQLPTANVSLNRLGHFIRQRVPDAAQRRLAAE